ncbi:MAG TPA: MBOAT family O-acyltransferase [Caulobacteraceae bacterium]|jgi:D-alanyl-lipoteichoic acid acyltransferase DltB (MBOAT superfamily)
MLFNSPQFIFAFLPLVVAGFYILGARSVRLALAFLVAASIFFYAWWRPLNVLIIAPSILINYALIRVMIEKRDVAPTQASIALWVGIAFNVLYLCYFKYTTFIEQVVRDVGGFSYVLDRVVLPLGLSFITFQKIALLMDAHAGRIDRVTLRDYMTFVLFFPPLISGPIVHYREIMPQFHAMDGRLRLQNIGLGVTLFFVGLAKKMIIADPLALLIAPYWQDAASGGHPALVQAWAAALGFMVQLYFDFSGYCDMAIGIARMFGITLPPNFDAPLKAPSLIEFWSRWHMTLTRFLTAYVFSPVSLQQTRARMSRSLPVLAGRKTTRGAFIGLIAAPTLQTMFISGLWHGAGYQFIIFGLLHGVGLVVNHGWRLWRPRWWPRDGAPGRLALFVSWGITILFVVFAQVFFRAPDVSSALRIWSGMLGLDGVTLPSAVQAKMAPLLAHVGVHPALTFEGGQDFAILWLFIFVGWLIALGAPTIYELTAAYNPALGWKPRAGQRFVAGFRPSLGWACALSLATTVGLLSLGQVSTFLYWKF